MPSYWVERVTKVETATTKATTTAGFLSFCRRCILSCLGSNMKRNIFSLAEYEGILSLSDPIYSKPARWERKLDPELLDRHIPHRSCIENNENLNKSERPQFDENATFLYNNVVGSSDSRVLLYKKKSPAPCEGHVNPLKVLYSTCTAKRTSIVKSARHIPSDPVRVLDAPGLMDDFCEQPYILCSFLRFSIPSEPIVLLFFLP